MSDKKDYNEKFFDTILKEAASLYADDLEDEYDNIEIPEQTEQYLNKHQDEMFNQIMSKIKEDEHNKNNNKKRKIFTFKKGLILVAAIVLIMAAALNTTAVKMYFVKTIAQRDGDIYSFTTGKVPENRYSELKEFNATLTMLANWSKYILNAFDCPYSNGFTEGTNNKIKVIKRNAYGLRNFENFRNRILMTSI